MDFSLTEEQEMLKKVARDFLEKECPSSHVREMEEDDRGFSPELWRKMAELGWMGLPFPEEYGGMGGDFLDLSVLLEEMGRVLLPSPFIPTVAFSGMPILKFGGDLRKELLSGISSGELIMTFSLYEPDLEVKEPSETRAERRGERFVVSGRRSFVPYLNVSQKLLVPARTEEGVSVFILPCGEGMELEKLEVMSGDKMFDVVIEGVLSEGVLSGEDILNRVINYGACSLSSYMLGGAQKVLEMTVNYAKERVQFGRPIGSFQAIQHKCADMAIEIDGARFAVYQAAWKLSKDMPCDMEVSVAKSWVGETYRRATATSIQVHGAIGTTYDHDVQLYYRRAKVLELYFGDPKYHKERVARVSGF